MSDLEQQMAGLDIVSDDETLMMTEDLDQQWSEDDASLHSLSTDEESMDDETRSPSSSGCCFLHNIIEIMDCLPSKLRNGDCRKKRKEVHAGSMPDDEAENLPSRKKCFGNPQNVSLEESDASSSPINNNGNNEGQEGQMSLKMVFTRNSNGIYSCQLKDPRLSN